MGNEISKDIEKLQRAREEKVEAGIKQTSCFTEYFKIQCIQCIFGIIKLTYVNL